MNIKKVLETYVNLYIPNKKEKFDAEGKPMSAFSFIYIMIMWLVTGFAIYLSFRCHRKFNLGAFLLAFFFAPFYIIYHLAVTGLCGLM
jgi:hypothetical protein